MTARLETRRTTREVHSTVLDIRHAKGNMMMSSAHEAVPHRFAEAKRRGVLPLVTPDLGSLGPIGTTPDTSTEATSNEAWPDCLVASALTISNGARSQGCPDTAIKSLQIANAVDSDLWRKAIQLLARCPHAEQYTRALMRCLACWMHGSVVA